VRLYRICPERYLENYSGLGASYKDGARWNRPGQAVIYFAASPSTALLEMANYLPSPRLIPKNYRLGIYELDKNAAIHVLPDTQLPDDWACFPYPRSTQQIGKDWLDKCNELGLLVPSSAVPQGLEKILVVNPRHPDIRHLKLVSSISELFNKRTFTGLDKS
jgi:RES domain-containing protein